MANLQSLKRIVDCLKEKQPIAEDMLEIGIDSGKQEAIFKLLAVIYNASLNADVSDINDNNKKIIILLEQLATVIGKLTSFPPICKLLAEFKKYQFYEACKERKDFACLVNRVFGLYPLTNIEGRVPKLLEFDSRLCLGAEVGNVNWIVTRTIFDLWLEKSRGKMTKEIALSCCILLSKQQLITLNDQWTLWDKLWIYLYLWLNRVFLQPYCKEKRIEKELWCRWTDQQFRQQIKDLKDIANSEEQQAILNLVLFALEEYSFKQAENDFFKQAITNFQLILSTQNNWQYLLVLHLIKEIALKSDHELIAREFQNIISDAIQYAEPSSKGAEFEYLLPHIIKKSEVEAYILKNKLEFWNYGLAKTVNENIAKLYFNELYNFDDEAKLSIILNLNSEYFIENLINSRELEGNKKLGKAAIKILLEERESIAQKFHTYLEIEDKEMLCRDLELLAIQWDLFYQIQAEGSIYETNFQYGLEFLTFDEERLSQKFRSLAHLPQKSPTAYSQILNKFTDYFVSNGQQTSGDVQGMFFNRNFVDYFDRLKEADKDALWAKWSNFLVQDPEILSQLMEIPALDPLLPENFLTEEEVFSLRRAR